jgi:hypothetical protein
MKTQSNLSVKVTTILLFTLMGLYPVMLVAIGILANKHANYQVVMQKASAGHKSDNVVEK